MRRFFCLFLLLALVGGCAPIDREKLAKEAVAKDPEFAAVLEKRKEIASRIQTYSRELAVRRSEVEKKIGQLNKDLVDSAASVRAKSEEIKTRMDPDRVRLQRALNQTGNDLRIKREMRSGLGKQIAMAKKSGTDAPPEMLKQAEELDRDLAALKERVRLLKIELLLIKI